MQLPKTGTGAIHDVPGKTLVNSGTGASVVTLGAKWSALDMCKFAVVGTLLGAGAGLT